MSVKSTIALMVISNFLGTSVYLNHEVSSTKAVGGCLISTQGGESGIGVEKTDFMFIGSSHSLLLSAAGDDSIKRSVIGRSFSDSADLPKVRAIMTSVADICDVAKSTGLTIVSNTSELRL